MALDLHCPHISGPHNEVIYLVGSENERNASEQRKFSELLGTVATGALRMFPEDFLPFGQAWNTAANYGDGRSFARWALTMPEVKLAGSIEIPYARARCEEVNQESARVFGEDLGRAIGEYLAG